MNSIVVLRVRDVIQYHQSYSSFFGGIARFSGKVRRIAVQADDRKPYRLFDTIVQFIRVQADKMGNIVFRVLNLFVLLSQAFEIFDKV